MREFLAPTIVTVYGISKNIGERPDGLLDAAQVERLVEQSHNQRLDDLQMLVVRNFYEAYGIDPSFDLPFIFNFPADRKTDRGTAQVYIEVILGGISERALAKAGKSNAKPLRTQETCMKQFAGPLPQNVFRQLVIYDTFKNSLQHVVSKVDDHGLIGWSDSYRA